MSLQLVDTWIAATIRRLDAAMDVARLFSDAEKQQVDATLLVSGQLTNNRRSYLVRWTGHELVVLQLSPRQQYKLDLPSGGLFRQLGFRDQWSELPAARQVTLSEMVVPDAMLHSGWSPLSGTCRFAIDDNAMRTFAGCALRLQYFRPDFEREVTNLYHLDRPVGTREGELEFTFAPLFSSQNPHQLLGPTFLFLQMVTSRDWRTLRDCQRVSNVVAGVIELVP